jgi:4-oxalocrotonate tautomerase
VPHIHVQILEGATRAQKAQLVKEFTESLARVMGKKPEYTNIIIEEIAEQDWGYAGLLSDEPKKI